MIAQDTRICQGIEKIFFVFQKILIFFDISVKIYIRVE